MGLVELEEANVVDGTAYVAVVVAEKIAEAEEVDDEAEAEEVAPGTAMVIPTLAQMF